MVIHRFTTFIRQTLSLHTSKLSRQLLIGFGTSLVTIGVMTLWVNYRLIQEHLQTEVFERAEILNQTLEFTLEGLLEARDINMMGRIVQNYITLPAVTYVAIINPDGLIIIDSSGKAKDRLYTTVYPELKEGIESATIHGIEISDQFKFENQKVLVQILPFSSVVFGQNSKKGVAIAFLDLEQIQADAWQTFMQSIVSVILGILAILYLIASLIHRHILIPLNQLNIAIANSQDNGRFDPPHPLPNNEIGFLALTFDRVFKELKGYQRLQTEIRERQQVEAALRESEAKERAKSEQLRQTLAALQKTQSQLIQSEKMSALGQMVAGIAHEINNPVNFIHGNITYTREYTEQLLHLIKLYQQTYKDPTPEIKHLMLELDLDFLMEDIEKILDSMQNGTHRIRDIVISLRNFSRLDESAQKQVDICEGIESTLMLVQHRLKKTLHSPGIQIVKDYEKLPMIECYPGELNQVFLNVMTNAIDALELSDRHPKILSIKTRKVSDNQISIYIKDNGIGISSELTSHLFEPFFTTKSVGQGTGLGLYISYQIVVERHQGQIECHSEIGQGSEFAITLPIQLACDLD